MSFNFDQFNQNSLVQPSSVRQTENQQVIPSGYLKISKDEKEIFQKSKMNLNLPASIVHLIVANDWLVVLMSNLLVFRLNIKQPDKQSEIFLDKYLAGQRVSKMFLDHTGTHLLLALTPKSSGYTADLMYINKNNNKPKIITKFRDHEVTAVAFNLENDSEQSTGNILIGTSKGLLFEADIGCDGDKLIQNNWKQVFDIGRGENGPIMGLGFFRAPNSNSFIVLVATIDRLYKFHETLHPVDNRYPPLQTLFTNYLNVPEEVRDYEQMPSKLSYSQLEFIIEKKFTRAFGWLTENGVFFGEMDSNSAKNPNFITSKKTLTYPEQIDDYRTASYVSKNFSTAPISMVLTDFHLLIQYSDHITGISLINHEVIYDEYFADQHGKLMAIVKDDKNGNIYTFSNKTIFRFKINDEKRNVWRMYLDQKEFELAKKYSQDNPAYYDIVLSQIADDFYEKKKFMESAKVFAQTKKSFEEVTLKFLQADQNLPLIHYLRCRLNEFVATSDQIQVTMLVVWLVELYLTEINRSMDEPLKSIERQKEFDEFLRQPNVESCLKDNRKLIYDLIASHGDNFNLTALTTQNEDYEDVISQHIQENEFRDALDTLKIQRKPDLFYQFTPIIMESLPKETIQILIERGSKLDPVKLLPTLLCLSTDRHRSQVAKYLEFAIHSLGNSDQAIHNYLIQIYARFNEHDKLMSYLETQGKEQSMINYDAHYALRLCKENNIKEACVFLMCLLEMWQQAVELALTFDSKLAQKTASQPSDRDFRRKLWLIIAEQQIKGKENVQEALELLKVCDLLRIEDLLPFFSDFQKIDHFKEAICESLKDYNQKIQTQKKEMEESAIAAEKVRSAIQSFRNRSVTISAQDKCSSCGSFLLIRPFFLFPCSHKFHADCLEKHLLTLFTPEEGQKLNRLKQKLNLLNLQIESSKGQNLTPETVDARDKLRETIENILAADCAMCGHMMIQQLDKQFDIANESW